MALSRNLRRDQKGRKRGGGGGQWWKIPKVGEPGVSQILLFPGKYVQEISLAEGETKKITNPYYITFSHFVMGAGKEGKGVSLTCSAGLAEYEEPDGSHVLDIGDRSCVPCHFASIGARNVRAASKQIVFNGVLMGNFHPVEREVDSKKRPGEKVKIVEYKDCTGRRCGLCRQEQPVTFGRPVHVGFGFRYIGQLEAFERTVLSKLCTCGGGLDLVGFGCSSSKCDHFLDVQQLTDNQISSLEEEEMECSSCGTVGFFTPVHECDRCSTPTPLDLWNVVLDLHRVGENKDSALQIAHRVATPEDLAKVKEHMTPLELERIFAPKSLEDQAKDMGVDNPFGGTGRPARRTEGSSTWDDDDVNSGPRTRKV